MTQRIRDDVERHAQGVGGFEALGVGVGLAVERALEIEGRVEHRQPLVEEEAVELGAFQRRVVAQRGRGEGDFLQRIPAGSEDGVCGREFQQFILAEDFFSSRRNAVSNGFSPAPALATSIPPRSR